MSSIAATTRVPRWAQYVGVWILLMVVCAPQTISSGAAESWGEVFGIQVSYWSSWAVLTLGIFWLCGRLYEGPRTLGRYVPAMLAATVLVSVAHPLMDKGLFTAREWMEWSIGSRVNPPGDFLSEAWKAMVKNTGTNPFMFAVIVCVWHAIRYGADLREKQIKALELEARLRQAELQALRSQLNPHFLFNTLHSIAELVHTNPDLAEQLIIRLGELLRKALETSGQAEATVAEEMEFIRAYLEIQQMRLGDRLRLDWDLAQDALGVKVPTLILQPVVENAIQHGIAASGGNGELRIRAARENGFLLLQVRDNGPGLPGGERGDSGIGLANTQARLRAIYGDQHRFEFVNQDGLTVNMRLPIAAS